MGQGTAGAARTSAGVGRRTGEGMEIGRPARHRASARRPARPQRPSSFTGYFPRPAESSSPPPTPRRGAALSTWERVKRACPASSVSSVPSRTNDDHTPAIEIDLAVPESVEHPEDLA
ncbi:hypothetical protein A4X06_0g1347 [Tilletia controversa]|uniref:Uncharacterized protein n=2 Tax=Tilletia TaxID=13289 RepID=A0A8X7MZR2_9BASI|nr:hypothetical protein CF336_g1092 [Tilletia laevis]KAE8253579.1 hypothetical protein A4X06_0g1347 [Tilletia controversa]KAE8265434.1 hypothetical protein A4X03_0g273 [Tilletia caries]